MKTKQGCEVEIETNFSPTIITVNQIADGIWRRNGVPSGVTITSGSEGEPGDGIHSYESLHYPANTKSGLGEAADYRIWHVDAEKVARLLRESVPSYIDVVLESNHIHVENNRAKK